MYIKNNYICTYMGKSISICNDVLRDMQGYCLNNEVYFSIFSAHPFKNPVLIVESSEIFEHET